MSELRTWIYHETEEPKIVDQSEAESYYDDGWADSPAKFIKTTDFGVEPTDVIAVQGLGESIQGVADYVNGSLNIDLMDKDELEDYAEEHFSIDLDKRKSAKNLQEQVKELIDGNRS